MKAERVTLETDENGHLSGLPPLPPGSKVEAILVILDSREADQSAPAPEPTASDKPSSSPLEILKRIAALPDQPANDNFSGEDHDKVLYGWEKRR